MSHKTYFISLALLASGIAAAGLWLSPGVPYWIWSSALLVIYILCKDVFTGAKWFSKPAPIAAEGPASAAGTSDEEYERYVEDNYPPVSVTERSGYLRLTGLCVHPARQRQLSGFFGSLKDFSGDDDYMTTLNYVMEYLDKQDIHFIMSMDWKADIDTLEWRISSALKDNYGIEIRLPLPGDFGERASVSFDHVFERFDQALRQQGFQMGFIDTESDQYVILVHKTEDQTMIGEAVNQIGYAYRFMEGNKFVAV